MTVFDSAVVVVPAHNEADNLPRCLTAMVTAAACAGAPASVIVVLDNSDDASDALAGQFGGDVHFVTVDAGNVGAARAAGFCFAQSLREADDATWYATTDADSTVDPDWLANQIGAGDAGADMVLGVVRMSDWRHLPAVVVQRYLRAYQARVGKHGHAHIHGANMGFRAAAYWGVGGFRALATGEDVDLVRRFEAAGHRVHRDSSLSVTTSAREQGRAPGGVAAHLRELSRGRRRRKIAMDPA